MASAVMAGRGVGGGAPSAMITESQRRIDSLSSALARMDDTTREAGRCCDGLSRRAKHLDSLTSPASDASALLTQAASNLSATLLVMKDAREKFDTTADCEPAIVRLHKGATEALETTRRESGGGSGAVGGSLRDAGGGGNNTLTEQDVYAAADSMEIVRDAYTYFLERKAWKSTPSALGGLQRVHQLGVDAMCALVTSHLLGAGPAVRMKRADAIGGGKAATASKYEAASETRARLSAALQNRDLMKSVGEYEEFLPLGTRVVRELRAIFECLGGDGCNLERSGAGSKKSGGLLGSSPGRRAGLPSSESIKVTRTEKVGSGCYTNLTRQPLKSGFTHLDSYGEARRQVAHASVDGYYRHLKNDRRKMAMRQSAQSSMNIEGSAASGADLMNVDAAARDAVRCLEHAMVVVAGEKSIYRCVVSPTSSHTHDETKVPTEYKHALVSSYSHVVASVVDRSMDVIESVFMKEAGCGAAAAAERERAAAAASGEGSNAEGSTSRQDIRSAASGAAAGLRILDGVRMLGPSLAKLCDMSVDGKSSAGQGGRPGVVGQNESVASSLCISIHRTTVKNTARTLENLAKAIQYDPLDGEKYRPKDARVAAVSSDVVRAIRIISPFDSAYKSVTKRRSLPWDPNIGEDAGDLDSFVRFLVMRLLSSLQGKALNYTKDPGPDAMAKSNLFLMNNTFYLLEQLAGTGPSSHRSSGADGNDDGENYKIDAPWFREKVNKIFESEKNKYLAHWEVLNSHLTAVDESDIHYQTNKEILDRESGRLLKTRFSGFIEDFERVYSLHREFTVIDPTLRDTLQYDVKQVFVSRYKRFFDKYSKIQFSKKNMDQYLKYPPQKVELMIGELFSSQ